MRPYAFIYLSARIAGYALAVIIILAYPLAPAVFGQNSQSSANLITITATNTSLATVLDQVCKDLDITCTTHQELSEPITIDLHDLTPEEALKKLLEGWNSIFLYDQTRPNGLRKILILSKMETRPADGNSADPPLLSVSVSPRQNQPDSAPTPQTTDSSPSLPTPEETTDIYGRGVFLSPNRQVLESLPEETFKEALSVASAPLAISTASSPAASSMLQKNGVMIAAVNNDLFRTTLGLQNGDVVRDVNGWPAEDPSQFITKLTEAVRGGETSILRLEVERKEKLSSVPSGDAGPSTGQERTVIQPIYINLGEPSP